MRKECLTCGHIGIDCLPYLVSLPPDELIEWCIWRKKGLHLSNADIADRTNVPKGTIDRLLASRNSEFRYSTMQPVVFLLLGNDRETVTCRPGQADAETMAAVKAQVERERGIAQSRLHTIRRLAIVMTALVLLIVAALMIDVLNPNIGFIWRY